MPTEQHTLAQRVDQASRELRSIASRATQLAADLDSNHDLWQADTHALTLVQDIGTVVTGNADWRKQRERAIHTEAMSKLAKLDQLGTEE